jgi:hypothetical protein
MFDSSDKKEQKQPEENKEQEPQKESKKGDYAEQAEKENNFYTMPTKESVSRAAGGSNGKLMGIVIMVCGVVVLAGAVYFSYIYLIAPQSQPQQVAEKEQDNQQADNQQSGQNEQTSGTQDEQDNANEQTDDEEDERDEKEKEDEGEKENGEEETATTTEEESRSETATSTDEDDDEETVTTTEEEADKEEETATTTDEDGKETVTDEADEEDDKEDSARQVAAEDTDNDGLSGGEEAIFGTDPEKADTDGDGFEDGAEVLNLYDPAQAEVPILENANIAEYADENYGYSILYPAEWEVNETGGDTSLIFKSEGREFIQLVIQENKNNSDIEEWYAQQFPGEEVSEDYVVQLKTWKGIKKQNRAIYYLTGEDKENIYILSYSASPDKTPQFGTIFNMMVKSFEVSGR